MRHLGFGKVILLGEHAVVYGYPALAAALDRGVTAAVVPTPAGGPLRLDVASWDMSVRADDDNPPGHALAAIADAMGLGRPALTIVADAQLPARAGLGSSAALAVAVARALYAHHNLRPTAKDILDAANASERVHHGTPSGIDVAIALTGGFGVFRKTTGLRPMTCAPLHVLIGPTGIPRSTARMVERVAEATRGLADDARLRELGGLTDIGAAALVQKDLPLLGETMDRAHTLLADLGVSTSQLDALVVEARKAGAHGAKLTGAGGGGAVIAIAPPAREAAILHAWRVLGVTGFSAQVGR